MGCSRWGHKASAKSGSRRSRGAQRGFTLIELVLAAGYFLIGISAVALFQIAAAKGSASAGDLMMATTLTTNQIETIRNSPALVIPLPSYPTLYYDRFGNAAAAPGFFAVVYTTPPVTSTTQYTSVTVTTTWRQSPVNPFLHSVTMQTYIGRY